MIVVPFKPEHATQMLVQRSQAFEVTHETLLGELRTGWTAKVNGEPVAAAGLVELWQGRAHAWALLSRWAGPYMLPITREIRYHLDAAPFRRIEMAVDAGFTAGCRWAVMLGFTLETPQPMASYFPNGNAAFLYARCK